MSRRSGDGLGIILLIGGFSGLIWSLLKYPIPTIICINIFTLVVYPDNFLTVFGISAVVVLIYYLAKKSNKDMVQKEEKKKIEEKFGLRIIDPNKSIFERNKDIIKKNLGDLRNDSWPYYIENKVRDCIMDIALVENKKQFSPTHSEYLKDWSSRNGIPKEWLNMKDELLKQFRQRFEDIRQEQKNYNEILEREEHKRQNEELQSFFESNKDLVDKFLEITERKVSIIDDYGDENWDILSTEIESVLTKIAKRDGKSDKGIKDFFKKGYTWELDKKYTWLKVKLDKTFREYHQAQKSKPTNINELKNLSGVEFEVWISKVLKENGFVDVRGTPVTGDQGADLIVKKDGRTIIIQAKRYQGSVGNRAVQEVIGAVPFYNGDEGWVITNSTFTPSAKALAQKNKIKLIDGGMLKNPNFLKQII